MIRQPRSSPSMQTAAPYLIDLKDVYCPTVNAPGIQGNDVYVP